MTACRHHFGAIAALIAGGCVLWSSMAGAETLPATDKYDTTHSLVGSYLAGRFARAQNDKDEAAEFYKDALIHDPKNSKLLEQAFYNEASRGQWDAAFSLAERLVAVRSKARFARLALALRAFKKKDYSAARVQLDKARGGPIGSLTTSLALAWLDMARGDARRALRHLDKPRQARWAQFFLVFHKALIADLADRTRLATSAFEDAMQRDTRSLRTALAFARHSAHAGNRRSAFKTVGDYLDKSQGDGHPLLRALKDELFVQDDVALLVPNVSSGMAEVFYGLGEALNNEGAIEYGVIYLQMALYLDDDHEFALAALASAYENSKQYQRAIDVYNRIPASSPLSTPIAIRRAFNLNSLDKPEKAQRILEGLLSSLPSAPDQKARDEDLKFMFSLPEDKTLKRGADGPVVSGVQKRLAKLGYTVDSDGTYGDTTRDAVKAFQAWAGLKVDGVVGGQTLEALALNRPSRETEVSGETTQTLPLTLSDRLEILDSIGNILRSRKKYAEAIPFYDRAIRLIEKPTRTHWGYYYARGTSYERIKNWPAAEVDLKKALSLFPNQPLILNYLGYSWIDQGIKLDQGMAYIEKAVALKPDDGFIVDSLGWAHYKQGSYDKAVRYLERAVELRPEDPVLNDHLGDALWRTGREREARFQWDQALSLNPEPADKIKIERKLDNGLVAAEPLAVGAATQARTTASTPDRIQN